MSEHAEAIQKKQEERATLLKEARDLVERAEKEERKLEATEQETWEKTTERVADLTQEIQRLQWLDSEERSLERETKPASDPDPLNGDPQRRAQPPDPSGKPAEPSPEMRAFRKYLQHRPPGPGLSESEHRLLQTDDDQAGGYLAAPPMFVSELIKTLDDEVFIMGWARTFDVRGHGAEVPVRTGKLSTFNWSSEIAAPTADASLKFGKRKLVPHYLSGEVDVSRDLMRLAVIPVDEIVREEIAQDSSEVLEDAFLTGNGAEQPLGVFAASADGISTARDVSDGNTGTEIRFDGLINAKYSIKARYWPRLRYLTSRTGAKQTAIQKDGEGQYIWRESVRAGEPDRVLGVPMAISERVPATFTSGNYVAIFGDFSRYWIVREMQLQIQKLIEVGARNNQDVFVIRLKLDGAPVLEEAFARVTLP